MLELLQQSQKSYLVPGSPLKIIRLSEIELFQSFVDRLSATKINPWRKGQCHKCVAENPNWICTYSLFSPFVDPYSECRSGSTQLKADNGTRPSSNFLHILLCFVSFSNRFFSTNKMHYKNYFKKLFSKLCATAWIRNRAYKQIWIRIQI